MGQNSFAPYDNACRHYAEGIDADQYGHLVDATPLKKSSGDLVLLHVYELAAFGQMNRLTATERFPIGGALHVGIEVYGREWSFGGGVGQGSGVICEVPRSNNKYEYRETVDLGRTALSDGEVALVIGDLLEKWQPIDYHWLHKNCLAFANELCERLGVARIPPWVDRFARGAGAVDMGMRGIADGLVESVHGVAESARDVMRALLKALAHAGRFIVRPQQGYGAMLTLVAERLATERRTVSQVRIFQLPGVRLKFLMIQMRRSYMTLAVSQREFLRLYCMLKMIRWQALIVETVTKLLRLES